jgi:hypothetical protein
MSNSRLFFLLVLGCTTKDPEASWDDSGSDGWGSSAGPDADGSSDGDGSSDADGSSD